MTQSNPHLKLPVMPLPPEPPPENDFPCCSQHAPSCCKSGSSDLLTASEVKVLTETATKFGYELGRKDAGEEIAESLEALADAIGAGDQREFLIDLADTARDIASQSAGATSDATSGVPGHPEVSEAVRSPQEPYEHVHSNGPDAADCTTCDGNTP